MPFEVDVLRVARTRRDGVDTLDDLPVLLPRADVVILVIPGTTETKGLVDAKFLDAMKHDALLVNVGRGSVVVTDDLVAALRAGTVRAALDVTDPEPLPDGHPLWSEPRALITPHIANPEATLRRYLARHVQENVARFANGEPLLSRIDLDAGY